MINFASWNENLLFRKIVKFNFTEQKLYIVDQELYYIQAYTSSSVFFIFLQTVLLRCQKCNFVLREYIWRMFCLQDGWVKMRDEEILDFKIKNIFIKFPSLRGSAYIQLYMYVSFTLTAKDSVKNFLSSSLFLRTKIISNGSSSCLENHLWFFTEPSVGRFHGPI